MRATFISFFMFSAGYTAATLAADTVSFNFASSTGNAVGAASNPLGAAETAGAPGYNVANWNNLLSDWGGNAGAVPSPILDSTGATVTGMTIGYDAPNAWNNGIGTTTGDEKMMRNYLDSGASDSPYFQISAAPYRKFDLLVYADGDGGSGQTLGPYVVRYNTTVTQTASQTEAATNLGNLLRAPVWLKETGNFSGAYTAVDTSASLSVAGAQSGNFMVFGGLKGTITLDPTQTTSVSRAPLNGVQIVKWETANVLPGADDPAAKIALYSGGVTVTANRTIGSLATSVGTYGDLIINPGVTLTLANGDLDLGDINHWVKGGGSITSGGSTLTVNRDISSGFSYVAGGTDVAFNGATIVDNGGGAVNLVKTGGGKLRITTSNPYTGTTTISQGSIELGNTSGLGNTTSAITLNDARTSYFTAALYLQTGNTLTRDITVANAGFTSPVLGSLEAGTGAFNGTLTLNKGVRLENIAGSTMTVNGAVGGAGSVTKGGAGTFILAAVNGYTGGTAVTGGVLQAASVADGGTGNIGPYSSGGNAYLAIANGTFRYTGSGTESTARYLWIDQGPGTIDVPNASANLRFTGTGGALSQTVTKTGAGTLLLADDITGAAGVTAGGGTLILTGGNGYSGATAINSGVLQIGDGGATGTLGAGAVTDNAALVIKRSNALSISTGITGTGTLTQAGAGTTTLTGVNTYAGTTYVNQGALLIDGSTASAGRIDVSAGATLGGGGSGGDAGVADDGILAPGGLDNDLALNSLSLGATSILKFDLDDPVSPFWNDAVAIGPGALVLDGRLQVGPQAGAPGYNFAAAPAGTKWLLMTYGGSITDNGVTVESAPALAPGLAYAVDSTSTPGSVFLAVIPEPASGALLALGLLLLKFRRGGF